MNRHKIQIYLISFSLLAGFSSSHFEKSLGLFGLISYPIIVFGIMLFVYHKKVFLLNIIKKLKPVLLFSLLLICLVTSYSLWYPYENTRSKGTDRDEALNQAAFEVLSFNYPYYLKTFVDGRPHELGFDGNEITILPGSILLAIPFVLLGNSTYQNFFWIMILFIFFAKYFRSYSYSFLTLFLSITSCLTFLFQVLIGSDYIANSIWILVFTVLFINNSKTFTRKSVVIGFLLGLGLASRFNFLLLLFPLSVYIYFETGCANLIKQIGTVIFSFSLLVIPFMLFDYKNFTPLQSSNFFSNYENTFPYASVIFPLLFIISGVLLPTAFRINSNNIYTFLSLILLLPVLAIITLDSISKGTITFELTHYAFAPFLLLSFKTFQVLNTNPGN